MRCSSSHPDAISPSFGPGSRERHVAAAEAAGLSYAIEEIPTLMLDVDTGDDLAALTTALAGRRGGAPSTRGALRRLERGRGHSPCRPEGRLPARAALPPPSVGRLNVPHMVTFPAHTPSSRPRA